ncbi:MAG: hypothetical protein ACRCU2_12230 [Planktothrix sp.]
MSFSASQLRKIQDQPERSQSPMAVGTLVICPDCIGNRSFCLPGYNCWRPDYTVESLLRTIQQALQYSQTQVKPLLT